MLLDSNIFIETLLAQERGRACRRLLERVRDGEIKATVTDFHIDSVAIVIENYGKDWRELNLFLSSLLRYKGLTIYPLDLASRIMATYLMRDHKLDLDDALAAQALRELSTDTIISYDSDFDRVQWIKRVTPEEAKGENSGG